MKAGYSQQMGNSRAAKTGIEGLVQPGFVSGQQSSQHGGLFSAIEAVDLSFQFSSDPRRDAVQRDGIRRIGRVDLHICGEKDAVLRVGGRSVPRQREHRSKLCGAGQHIPRFQRPIPCAQIGPGPNALPAVGAQAQIHNGAIVVFRDFTGHLGGKGSCQTRPAPVPDGHTGGSKVRTSRIRPPRRRTAECPCSIAPISAAARSPAAEVPPVRTASTATTQAAGRPSAKPRKGAVQTTPDNAWARPPLCIFLFRIIAQSRNPCPNIL